MRRTNYVAFVDFKCKHSLFVERYTVYTFESSLIRRVFKKNTLYHWVIEELDASQ